VPTRAAALLSLVVLFAAAPAGAGATPTVAHLCSEAARLASVDPDAAKAAIAQAAALAPSKECTAAVDALAPAHPTMQSIEDFITAWGKVIGAVVGAALLVLALLAAAFSLATHSSRIRRGLRRVWFVGRFFQPSVSVGTIDDSAATGHGVAVSGLIGLALRRLSSDGGGVTLDVITGAESFGDSVAKLGDVAPQFKALGAILGFITDTAAWPRYQLSGALEPDAGQGLGLTLALDKKQSAIDGTLLTREPLNGSASASAAALEMLAMVAAGWAEYAIRWTDVKKPADVEKVFDYNAKPRSYAYLRAGSVLEFLGHKADAIQAYRQAVREDGTNAGALANLGRLVGRDDELEGERLLTAALLALEPTR
jgi:hypothetical protein